MDASTLKDYIYKNKKVEFILDEIGCHNIKLHNTGSKEYYTCANYNGDNPTAINVYSDRYLGVKNYTRDFKDKSDIITLVEYNLNFDFKNALKYLHKILDLPFTFKNKEIATKIKKDPLSVFKKIRNRTKVNVADIQYLDNNLIDYYIPILHIKWFKEGIMYWTAKKFDISYSYRQKRIIIPMKYWQNGELLGTNARTTIDNYEELGIKKFFITPTYPKGLNLYGLYENYDDIKMAGYVVIFEAEKSVLKRDSLCDSTAVALSGHTISDEQVRILIGLNVEIVIALDKDININQVRLICDKFYGIRNVSYIYDKDNLLNDKDSPADTSNKNYITLFKNRIIYDYTEHQKLVDALKK